MIYPNNKKKRLRQLHLIKFFFKKIRKNIPKYVGKFNYFMI